MNKKLLETFGESSPEDSIKHILNKSSTASCAPGERFVTVKKEDLAKTLAALKSKGLMTEVTIPTRKQSVRKIYFAGAMGI